jgi:predicted metal-dependent HD superfamily phosphohydrolase
LIAKDLLPNYGYESNEIERICGMIMATKIPQSPKNLLEQIICDADLDYLGRDDFFAIGNTLFEELKALGILEHKLQWDNMQVKFLENHAYHTQTTKDLREAKKQEHIAAVKRMIQE